MHTYLYIYIYAYYVCVCVFGYFVYTYVQECLLKAEGYFQVAHVADRSPTAGPWGSMASMRGQSRVVVERDDHGSMGKHGLTGDSEIETREVV